MGVSLGSPFRDGSSGRVSPLLPTSRQDPVSWTLSFRRVETVERLPRVLDTRCRSGLVDDSTVSPPGSPTGLLDGWGRGRVVRKYTGEGAPRDSAHERENKVDDPVELVH